MRRKIISRTLAGLLALTLNTVATAAAVNQASPVGINTNEAMETDTSVPFVDLFKLSMPFDEAKPWFTKGHVQFDRFGWPSRLNRGTAGTRFLNQINPQALPQGLYTVKYDGNGKIRYGASAKLVKRMRGMDLIKFQPMTDNKITATLFIDETLR